LRGEISNLSFAEKLTFFSQHSGTVSNKVVCYPAHDLVLTHLRSDLQEAQKFVIFGILRVFLIQSFSAVAAAPLTVLRLEC